MGRACFRLLEGRGSQLKLILTGVQLSGILRWFHRALFAAAVSMLVYSGAVVVDTQIFQAGERRRLERVLNGRAELSGASRESAPSATFANDTRTVAEGGLIGQIEITRLGVSAIVVEGTSTSTLRRAVGHIGGTALPGEPGNAGLSGHRDTFFRPLRNIRRNDLITVTTLLGDFRYRVVSTRVVGPHDVGVLDPSATETLTLVTCYPFYFVGSAPQRFIVRAERVENSPHETDF
jgi:sortase A